MDRRFPQQNQSPSTGFTEREIELINKVRAVMPPPFLKEYTDDYKILAFIQLVVDDINYQPPLTDYLVATIPPFFDTVIVLGTMAYTQLFLQAKWSLNDLAYSDGGFTINYDRVNKIGTAYGNFLKLYQDKTKAIKYNQLNTMVLATPRYANQLGTFVRLAIR